MKRILAIETPSSYHVLSVFLDEISIGFEALEFQVDRVCPQELLGQPFHLYEFIFCINAVYLENIAFFCQRRHRQLHCWLIILCSMTIG